MELINKHNSTPGVTYSLGITPFTDMTYEELKAKYLVDFKNLEGTSKCERTADLSFVDDI